MNKYHKIQTVYLRDPETKFKTLLNGQFSTPEFEYLAENEWVFTEKVDGTNIRIMFDGENIKFGGKTDNASIPSQLVSRLNETFLPKTNLFKEKFDSAICLYGEGYGAKIQNGGNYRQDQDFILFDVNINGIWLERDSVEDIANFLGIDVVPVIGCGALYDMIEMTMQGFTSMWGNFQAEGIVARPKYELLTRRGDRIITKIKHKDFAVV